VGSGAGSELTDVRSAPVKAAIRLRKKSYREHDRAFLAEGPQAVREALIEATTNGSGVRDVFVTAAARARHPDLIAQADTLGIPVRQASGRVLSELSDTVTPQGVVAVCDVLDVPLAVGLGNDPAAGSTAGPRIVVLLAGVRDPGNAGTVLRAADAAGASTVIFSDNSVDPYNGKCVRASAGSLFHVRIVINVAVDAAITALHSSGCQVLAADGTSSADSLDDVERAGGLALPTAWIFGNEAWGLPAEILRAADRVVRVPLYGRAESLNLAAAAAVCLYASARAQRS
jgi:TrmH family RNA methyltransferase